MVRWRSFYPDRTACRSEPASSRTRYGDRLYRVRLRDRVGTEITASGFVPPGVMVVYTPRDEQKAAVCLSLFWKEAGAGRALLTGVKDLNRWNPAESGRWPFERSIRE